MKEKGVLKKAVLVSSLVILLTIGVASASFLESYGQTSGTADVKPSPHIKLWWRFNENPGDSASDTSIHGNPGDLINMGSNDWVEEPDGSGYVLEFDRFNDYVQGPSLENQLNPENGVTVEAWSNPSWRFTNKITITNPGSSSLEDYQVKINLGSNFDFEDAQDDGADIRFWNETEELNYWIEEWNKTEETATIWVKIPEIPADGTTIFMYYGNPEASSASSGVDTFDFFEDAQSYSEGEDNPDGWSIVEYQNAPSRSLTAATKAGSRTIWNSYYYNEEGSADTFVRAGRTINLQSATYKFRADFIPRYVDYGGDYQVTVHTDDTKRYDDNPYSGSYGISSGWKNDVWSKIEFQFTDSVDTLKLGHYFNNLSSGTPKVVFDNIRIRKYSSSEPSATVLSDKTTIPEGWNHVALVYDGDEWTYFENGEQEPEPTMGQIITSEPNLTIGRGYIGKLDEFKVWDMALSQETIQYEFDMLKQNYWG